MREATSGTTPIGMQQQHFPAGALSNPPPVNRRKTSGTSCRGHILEPQAGPPHTGQASEAGARGGAATTCVRTWSQRRR